MREQRNDDRIRILEQNRLHDGYFKLDAYRLRHRLHSGGWSNEMRREVFERGSAAALLPYDPERDAVVLIEQFRLPAFIGGMDAWQVEIVAGIIESGETPEDVVRRECVEEAGVEVGEMVTILRYLPSPGACTENVHLFCGRIDSRKVCGVHGIDDEHEDIRPFSCPASDAFGMMERGEIQSSPALIAVAWLHRHRDRLRNEWLASSASA